MHLMEQLFGSALGDGPVAFNVVPQLAAGGVYAQGVTKMRWLKGGGGAVYSMTMYTCVPLSIASYMRRLLHKLTVGRAKPAYS